MTILDILKYPDETLKQVSARVESFDDELRKILSDLEETMRAGPGGVGIAAPQVGHFQRIAIVDVSAKREVKHNGCMILINPEIKTWDGMKVGREGCMSVPDYTGNVIRATKISLQASNAQGELIDYECDGYEARAVQHELDHLDGLLFLDRLVSRRTDLFKRKVYK
ncbi:MAG: peptide deformylase [Proteobacteria bacterium]|nr:peptide deformylase [Pseudomonadota bacterium]